MTTMICKRAGKTIDIVLLFCFPVKIIHFIYHVWGLSEKCGKIINQLQLCIIIMYISYIHGITSAIVSFTDVHFMETMSTDFSYQNFFMAPWYTKSCFQIPDIRSIRKIFVSKYTNLKNWKYNDFYFLCLYFKSRHFCFLFIIIYP